MDWIQQWQSKLNKQNGVAPLVRTGGSRHTGLAALPYRNIHVERPGGSVKRRPGKRFFDGLLPDFQQLSGRVADYAGSGLDFSGYHGAAGRLRVLCGKRRAEAV